MSRHDQSVCLDLANLLQPFVDNELTDGERKSVLEHVHVCPTCAACVREQQQVQAVVRNVGLTGAPTRLRASILRALDHVDQVEHDGAQQDVGRELATLDAEIAGDMSRAEARPLRVSRESASHRHLSAAATASVATLNGAPRGRTWGQRLRQSATLLGPALAAGIAIVALNSQNLGGVLSPAQLSAIHDPASETPRPQAHSPITHETQPLSPVASPTVLASVDTSSERTVAEDSTAKARHDDAVSAERSTTAKADANAPALVARSKTTARSQARNERVDGNGEVNFGLPPRTPGTSQPRKNRRQVSGGEVQWASTNHLPSDIAFESAGPSTAYYRELSLGLKVVDQQGPADEMEPNGRLFRTSQGPFFLSRDGEGRARVQFVAGDVFHELTLPEQQPAAFDLPIDPNRSDFRQLIEVGGAIRRAAAGDFR